MDSARVKLLLLQVWTEYFQVICCLRLGLILSQTTQAENITSKKAVGGRQTKLCRGRMVDCFSNFAFLVDCNHRCNHKRGPWLAAPPRIFWNPWLCKREVCTHLLGSPRLTGLYKRWARMHTLVDPPPEDLNCWTPGEDINVGSKEWWNPLLFLSSLFFSFFLFPLSFLF